MTLSEKINQTSKNWKQSIISILFFQLVFLFCFHVTLPIWLLESCYLIFSLRSLRFMIRSVNLEGEMSVLLDNKPMSDSTTGTCIQKIS